MKWATQCFWAQLLSFSPFHSFHISLLPLHFFLLHCVISSVSGFHQAARRNFNDLSSNKVLISSDHLLRLRFLRSRFQVLFEFFQNLFFSVDLTIVFDFLRSELGFSFFCFRIRIRFWFYASICCNQCLVVLCISDFL